MFCCGGGEEENLGPPTHQYTGPPRGNPVPVSGLKVEYLPGFDGPLALSLETRYIGVDEGEDAQMFYYLVESENNPEEDPLLVWFTGGPGCSSISGLLYEIEFFFHRPGILPPPSQSTGFGFHKGLKGAVENRCKSRLTTSPSLLLYDGGESMEILFI